MFAPKRLSFQQILKDIELDILTGVLKPKERLIEKDLMVRFNTNRNTIRKVLKELQLKQLVEHFLNRGAIVADLSEDEIQDIYSLRNLLERFASDLVVQNIGGQQLKKIRQCHKQFKDAVKEKNFREIVTKNIEFHESIFQASGNRVLTEMIKQLQTRSHLVRQHIWRLPGELRKSLEGHAAILQALENGDASLFKRINEMHTRGGVKRYLEFVRRLKK